MFFILSRSVKKYFLRKNLPDGVTGRELYVRQLYLAPDAQYTTALSEALAYNSYADAFRHLTMMFHRNGLVVKVVKHEVV